MSTVKEILSEAADLETKITFSYMSAQAILEEVNDNLTKKQRASYLRQYNRHMASVKRNKRKLDVLEKKLQKAQAAALLENADIFGKGSDYDGNP